MRNAPNVVRIVGPEWRAWPHRGGAGKSVPHSPPQLKTPASAQRKRTWAAEGRQAEAERITKRAIGTAPKSLLGATSEKANCDSPPWTTRERWMRLGMSRQGRS